jgi:hypothetical protein
VVFPIVRCSIVKSPEYTKRPRWVPSPSSVAPAPPEIVSVTPEWRLIASSGEVRSIVPSTMTVMLPPLTKVAASAVSIAALSAASSETVML